MTIDKSNSKTTFNDDVEIADNIDSVEKLIKTITYFCVNGIGGEVDIEDEKYLKKLKDTLPNLIAEQQPDFIFYLCGVDILETDKLGRLFCSINGCKERDRFVLQTCHDLNIPVQCSMGGGYSKEIRFIIDAHANTYRQAKEIYF
jgi:acetoin utilization deacetylase AcuC-like enzyme